MVQHRFRTAAIVGEWRPSHEEACQDALRLGLARPDERKPDGVSWTVPGGIEKARR